ncbi:N-methyltryptophan oxidase [Streptomyces albus]|uniref:N-methyltryptophan oxidase n=1 Tax=Streptomyces albus (strain ATCC 21838 / DSM 41398 / FERM P-419 / JCM 4703 / NBRC 107858) TaxID=1081613 RepID=A0A0B5EET9_STRA4|nr:N-methyltryptophan oxidase [Streptomyces albus]AOU74783.1 N-methyltryptophan oxidase [Streptomyces albus]AYN30594.1 FAD-dependent oxidoreductase [Streptomyces albus]
MTTSRTYDVAVLGLGGVGSMAAWRAAARGARTIGIEQFGEAHSRGSSHGGSRIFRQTLFEGSAYVPLVDRALRLWRELEAHSPTALFRRTGGLCIGPRGSAVIAQALRSAEEGGFEHRLLEPDEFADRYPQHAVIEGDVAVFEPGAGVLNPERCVSAALARAREAGADIRLRTRVSKIHHDTDGVRIDIGDEQIHARRAIVATGAWFTELVPDLDLPLTIIRSPLVWFKGADRAAYGPDRFPVFVRKSGDLDGWGITDVDGAGVKIGAGPSAPKPLLDAADDNVYPIDRRDTDPVEEFCRRAFPGLDPVAAAAEPCMNSRTPDRDFLIGTSVLAPSLVLASGFSGHGFKHAAASGDVCADLALDGASGIPLDAFSPDRFRTEEH